MLYAEQFGIPPGEVTRTTTARWWYRWTAWQKMQNARQAFEMAGHLKNVPPDVRAAMEWAEEKYVLNPKTQTFEKA